MERHVAKMDSAIKENVDLKQVQTAVKALQKFFKA